MAIGFDDELYCLLRKYVQKTIEGAGGVKGAPCQILSITRNQADNANVVTFAWEDNVGDVETREMVVPDGAIGPQGPKGDDADCDDVWEAQSLLGAKNLLVYPYNEQTITRNGITFTPSNDGALTISGTSTEYSYFNLEVKENLVPHGTYIFSANVMDFPNAACALAIGLINKSTYTFTSKARLDKTISDSVEVEIDNTWDGYYIGVRAMIERADITLNDYVLYPMLRLASDTDSTWQPYAPTNKELADEVSGKMDKVNPTGTGSFSLNRRANTTVGTNSFAEGDSTIASGNASHSEGSYSVASAMAAHAEGTSQASAQYSHAQNKNTIAQGMNQTALGMFNIGQGIGSSLQSTDYAVIIGNGTDADHRSNALAIQWDGTVVFQDGTTVRSANDFLSSEELEKLGFIEDFSKYENAVNVKDYGAVGDGTTDDSAAFISAISVANVTTIVIPRGEYNLSHTLITLLSSITFVGEDSGLVTLKDANIEAPYGITVKNITFDGGTTRTVSERGFPSGNPDYGNRDSMQGKKVTIFATPRYDDASVIYEKCVFKNTDIASLAFWGGNNDGTPVVDAKPFVESNAINCVFENITNCGIWHSVNIGSAKYIGNVFKNIGGRTVKGGKIWGLSLGDISNNSNQEVTKGIIRDNMFDTLETDIDTVSNADIPDTNPKQPNPDFTPVNANFIAITCDSIVITNNVIKDMLGYGHDHEGIYTKGNDVEIAYNTILNGCPGGEGNLCCKHKQYKQTEKRLMKIHDNTIISEIGTGIMCYGSGSIERNCIRINKVFRAIRGSATHPIGNEYIVIEDNNISCGVGTLTVGETEIADYGPEHIIFIGSEYPNGVHINRNTIAVTNDNYSDVFAVTLIKVQNIISDVEIKGNNAFKSSSTNAMHLTDSSWQGSQRISPLPEWILQHSIILSQHLRLRQNSMISQVR